MGTFRDLLKPRRHPSAWEHRKEIPGATKSKGGAAELTLEHSFERVKFEANNESHGGASAAHQSTTGTSSSPRPRVPYEGRSISIHATRVIVRGVGAKEPPSTACPLFAAGLRTKMPGWQAIALDDADATRNRDVPMLSSVPSGAGLCLRSALRSAPMRARALNVVATGIGLR